LGNRFLISFSYEGTNFHGYQKQGKLRTVQKEIEIVLKKINNNQTITIYAVSRTDKKVHALNQFAHFDLKINIKPDKLKRAMNTYLPEDIYIKTVKIVPADFYARYRAKKKEYEYIIETGEYDLFQRNYIYYFPHKLNIYQIKKALKQLKGEHDFTSFVSAEETRENKIRTIYKASVKKKKTLIYFNFQGNGFLKYQIRNMIGTLLMVGLGKKKPEDIKVILEKKDRRSANKTANPEGLYLKNIWFD